MKDETIKDIKYLTNKILSETEGLTDREVINLIQALLEIYGRKK